MREAPGFECKRPDARNMNLLRELGEQARLYIPHSPWACQKVRDKREQQELEHNGTRISPRI